MQFLLSTDSESKKVEEDDYHPSFQEIWQEEKEVSSEKEREVRVRENHFRLKKLKQSL